MNALEAIASIQPAPAIAKLATKCPWCGKDLDQGRVVAEWRGAELVSLSQTVRMGRNDYTWMHRAVGCFVPATARLPRWGGAR